jgi:type II secretory pathway component PulF
MPQFTWMARDPRRALRSGLIEAPSAWQANLALRRQALGGVAVLPVPAMASAAADTPLDLSRVSIASRMGVVSHLRLLIGQGVPPSRACAVAGASAPDAQLSDALHRASLSMRERGSLCDALQAQPALLNRFAAALLRAAEGRGMLYEGLKDLYQYLEFEEQLDLRRSPRGWRRWASRVRVVRPLSPVAARLLTLTHFFGCLALGQRAGLGVPATLLATQEICGDADFQREIAAVHQAMVQGQQGLAEALDMAGLLPMTSRQPLEAAQAEGRLADMLVELTRELRSHAEAALAA